MKRMTWIKRGGGEVKHFSTHILMKRMTQLRSDKWTSFYFSTHILMKRMTISWSSRYSSMSDFQLTSSWRGWLSRLFRAPRPFHFSTHILTRRMTQKQRKLFAIIFFNSHPHEEDDQRRELRCLRQLFSTHILTRRMTAILNKIFSFKIKLYIHYNILFAIFYIYNSILYPFFSKKRSYSGANDSANYCSLAFRTPRFPIPSLQIHFP